MSSAAKNTKLQQDASLREYQQALRTHNPWRALRIRTATLMCWPEMEPRFFLAALEA